MTKSAKTTAPAKIKKVAEPKSCTCGCEGTTKGGLFLPGHDARFVGLVTRAVLSGGITDAQADERMTPVSDLLKAKIRRSIDLGRQKAEATADAK